MLNENHATADHAAQPEPESAAIVPHDAAIPAALPDDGSTALLDATPGPAMEELIDASDVSGQDSPPASQAAISPRHDGEGELGLADAAEPARALFADLGLSAPLLQAIAEMGYLHPTPIQEQAIPVVLMGRDVLGVAQTGTGKTASFTLPLMDILAGSRARARMPRSVILEPTRELALQWRRTSSSMANT